MNFKDIARDMIVYHSIFPQWGRGVVKDIRRVDALDFKTTDRILVEWEDLWNDQPFTNWCRVSELRKTPNKKKVEKIVGFDISSQSKWLKVLERL